MTSVSPSLDIYSVSTTMINLNKLSISIRIEDTEERSVETLGLIDSGAGGNFIDQNYAKRMGFKTHKLEKPLQAYNVDGAKNKRGTIKYYVNLNLEINGKKMTMELLVTGLGKKESSLDSLGCKNKTQISIGRQVNSLGENLRNEDF